jgi:hypothetical protein
MPRAARFNDPVEVDVRKFCPGGRAPVAQQTRLEVREAQRLFQQRVIEQIELPDRQVVDGAPPSIDQAQLVVA